MLRLERLLGKSLLSNGVLHWHTAIRRSESTNIISHKYVHFGCVKTIQNGSDSGQMPLQSWALYWHTAIKRHTRCMFVSDICKGHQHIYFNRLINIYIYIYIIGRLTPHVNNFPKLRRSKAKQEEPCDVKLCDVNLYAVKLCAVNLCDVSLCDVNLCDSNMCDVNLCDVNLCDSNMCDVKLCDVNVLFVFLCGVEEEGGRGGANQKTKTPHVNVQNIYCIYTYMCVYLHIYKYLC